MAILLRYPLLVDVLIIASLGGYFSWEELVKRKYNRYFSNIFLALVLIATIDSLVGLAIKYNEYALEFENYVVTSIGSQRSSEPPHTSLTPPSTQGSIEQPPPPPEPVKPDIPIATTNPNPQPETAPPAARPLTQGNPVATDNSWLVDPKAMTVLHEGLKALVVSQCDTAKARITTLSRLWDGHSITWNAEHDTPEQAKSRQQYMDLVVGSRRCVPKKGAESREVGRATGPMPDASGKMPECSTLACLDAEIAERRKYLDMLKRANPGTN